MKNMNRKQKIIVSVTGIFIVLLILVGLTYAYFLTQVKGNENNKSISVTTAYLALEYSNGTNDLITSDTPITPNFTSSMDFKVTNTGTGTIEDYGVVLEEFYIAYANNGQVKNNDGSYTNVTKGELTSLAYPDDMKLTITCKSSVSGKTCAGYDSTLPTTNDILLTNDIDPKEVQTYVVTLTYKETGEDQSKDMNKTIEGKINIIDTKDTVDIAGTVADYAAGDYVQTNSVERISKIYSNGTYKIVGLEAGTHRVRVFDKTGKTTKLDKTINIVKGNTAGVSGSTLTITDETRTAIVNITSSGLQMEFESTGTLLKDAILTRAKSGISGASVFGEPLTTLGNSASNSEKVLASIEDDDGNTSYYFRGRVKDNYVEFNNMCWRIVRIEGDNSVKLILHNGTGPDCVTNKYDVALIGEGIFGYVKGANGIIYDDYGKINGTEDTKCETVKCKLDTWYIDNFSKVDSFVKSDNNCLGDTITYYGFSSKGPSFYQVYDYDYVLDPILYSTAKRMAEKNITLICDGKYTDASKTTLITADEAVLSGISSGFGDYGTGTGGVSYLMGDVAYKRWSTLSVSSISGGVDNVYIISNEGWAGYNSNGLIRSGSAVQSDWSNQIRPVISLIPGVTIKDGSGTNTDPYKIG